MSRSRFECQLVGRGQVARAVANSYGHSLCLGRRTHRSKLRKTSWLAAWGGMLAENSLHIYTDGSSLPSPRRGGIGIRFLLIDSEGREEIIDSRHAGYKGSTNNQMELQACIEALEEAGDRGLASSIGKIVVHTDSQYVVGNVNQAKFTWPKQRWMTRQGTPVLNVDLWKRLVRAIKNAGRRVDFEWVQGHSKDLHNRAVDKMAKGSAKSALRPALSVVSVRKKWTAESVAIGSVRMLGQRLSIRVITCEWLHQQKLWKLKYEVISAGSPFLGKVDIMYATSVLADGHAYFVQVNQDTANPRIVRVFRELTDPDGTPRSRPVKGKGNRAGR
jgi:ribonuclease HI